MIARQCFRFALVACRLHEQGYQSNFRDNFTIDETDTTSGKGYFESRTPPRNGYTCALEKFRVFKNREVCGEVFFHLRKLYSTLYPKKCPLPTPFAGGSNSPGEGTGWLSLPSKTGRFIRKGSLVAHQNKRVPSPANCVGSLVRQDGQSSRTNIYLYMCIPMQLGSRGSLSDRFPSALGIVCCIESLQCAQL